MGLGYLPRCHLGLREGADVLLTHVESEHDDAQQTLGSSRRPGAWLSLSSVT
jgi:hypothetical protein